MAATKRPLVGGFGPPVKLPKCPHPTGMGVGSPREREVGVSFDALGVVEQVSPGEEKGRMDGVLVVVMDIVVAAAEKVGVAGVVIVIGGEAALLFTGASIPAAAVNWGMVWLLNCGLCEGLEPERSAGSSIDKCILYRGKVRWVEP